MEKYSFFNAVVSETGAYDREYLAEDYAQYFASFIGNGVYAKTVDCLKISAIGNMTIKVKAGKAWINGYYYESTADKTFDLELPDGTNKRIDRVVVRLDLTNRKITTEVKKGVKSLTPVAADITRNATVYELVLADIAIDKNITAINSANITDQRMNTSLCGVVSGVVDQINTEGLFSQYQAQFDAWFNGIKGKLSGDIAGSLQTQINTINTNITQKIDKTKVIGTMAAIQSNTDAEFVPSAVVVKSISQVTTSGWNPINENEAFLWTTQTVSAPNFEVQTKDVELGAYIDLSYYLSVGMKIRLVQGGVTKYFFIVKIAGDRIILFGGIDYVLTNAAISDVYYSVVESPYGFPSTLNKTRILRITREANTNGTQEIILGFRPTLLKISAFLRDTLTYESVGSSDGNWAECIDKRPNGFRYPTPGTIVSMHTGGATFLASVSFTDLGFRLEWTNIGTVPAGTILMLCEVQ